MSGRERERGEHQRREKDDGEPSKVVGAENLNLPNFQTLVKRHKLLSDALKTFGCELWHLSRPLDSPEILSAFPYMLQK